MKYLTALYQLYLDMAPYLLFGLIFVGLLNVFVKKEYIARHLGGKGFLPVLYASLFGVPMPLCSCGVIPTAVYMKKNGASGGSVASFLISTPQTGVDSILATYGMLGWVFAIYRPVSAFLMGIIGGSIYGRTAPDLIETEEVNTCHDSSCTSSSCTVSSEEQASPLKKMFRYAFVEFLDDISVHFVIGLLIAALITFLIPDGFFSGLTIGSGILGMIVVILVGVPMYICATASIPIAMALMTKGFSPGVALVFLTVGPATNIATLSILLKVLGKKGVFVYLSVLIVLAVLSGLAFDGIHTLFEIDHITKTAMHSHGKILPEWLVYSSSILFGILLLASLIRKLKGKGKDTDMTTIKIEGMNCNHCVANVERALKGVAGVATVDVSLKHNEAVIDGDFDIQAVIKAIEDVGYKASKG